MGSAGARASARFLVPGGVLLAGAVICERSGALFAVQSGTVSVFAPVVLVAGLLLGWRFGRGRLVLALLALALAEGSLVRLGAFFDAGSVRKVVGVLLPLNLAIFSLMKDRGLLTLHSLWGVMLVLFQPLAAVMAFRVGGIAFGASLEHRFVQWPLVDSLHLPQPALAAFAIAFAASAAGYYGRRSAMEAGFFWAVGASVLALTTSSPAPAQTFYFAVAALILAASVIEVSHSLAFRDELTDLPARRALNEAMQKLGHDYSVAMVDIDRFKRFNDRYGHDAGDQVLRMVGSLLSKISGGGRAYRYGGEEFSILFPGKRINDVMPHLERFRKELKSRGFFIRGPDRPRTKPAKPKASKTPRRKATITVSIGVAQRDGRRTTPQQVIKAADRALYRAKRSGRNRIRRA